MSFGIDLWDQQEALTEYIDKGLEQMMSLSEFMKEIAAAEESYTAEIKKIVKPCKDSISKMNEKANKSGNAPNQRQSDILHSWVTLIDGVDKIAEMHNRLSEQVTKLRKTLKHSCVDEQVESKKQWERANKSQAELLKVIADMQQNKDSYCKELAGVELTMISIEKKTKEFEKAKADILEKGEKGFAEKQRKEADLEKTKADLKSRIYITKVANAKYQDSIANANTVKTNHLRVLIPEVFDKIQKDDQSVRIGLTKDTLSLMSAHYERTAPVIAETWKNIHSSSIAIDSAKEVEIAIANLGTGNQIPPDFTVADTNADIKEKSSLKAKDFQNVKPDDLRQMDPRAGKKAAQELSKFYDKEIQETEKQARCIGALKQGIKDMFMDKENEEFSSNLASQTASLLDKVNYFVQQKHFLHCYLAEIEGKAEPPIPPLITTFDGLQTSLRSSSYDTLAGSSSPNQKRGVSIFNRFSSTSVIPVSQHATSPLKAQTQRESVQNIEDLARKVEKNRGSQAQSPTS